MCQRNWVSWTVEVELNAWRFSAFKSFQFLLVITKDSLSGHFCSSPFHAQWHKNASFLFLRKKRPFWWRWNLEVVNPDSYSVTCWKSAIQIHMFLTIFVMPIILLYGSSMWITQSITLYHSHGAYICDLCAELLVWKIIFWDILCCNCGSEIVCFEEWIFWNFWWNKIFSWKFVSYKDVAFVR